MVSRSTPRSLVPCAHTGNKVAAFWLALSTEKCERGGRGEEEMQTALNLACASRRAPNQLQALDASDGTLALSLPSSFAPAFS